MVCTLHVMQLDSKSGGTSDLTSEVGEEVVVYEVGGLRATMTIEDTNNSAKRQG